MKCEGLGAPGVSLGYLGEKSRSEERQGCESSTARPYVSARPRYTLQCPPLGHRAARGLSTSRGRRCPVSPGKRAPGWKPWMRGANGVVSPRSVKVLEVEAGALAAGLPAVRMLRCWGQRPQPARGHRALPARCQRVPACPHSHNTAACARPELLTWWKPSAVSLLSFFSPFSCKKAAGRGGERGLSARVGLRVTASELA